MKKNYELYKTHYNDKFIGWEVGYLRRTLNLTKVATFYGRYAKKNTEEFINQLKNRVALP